MLLFHQNTHYNKIDRYAWSKHFYETSDDVYRENKMTEIFILAFDSLNGEQIMGIYGASHIGLYNMDFTGKAPSMANQLREHYGDIIYSENLSGK